jgi:ABC transporter DrrB family efflux protein
VTSTETGGGAGGRTGVDVTRLHALERPQIRRTTLPQQALVITRRNLIHIKRMPEMLMDVTIQPVMFVLLFAFVFGGAINVQSSASGYREWLLGGIMGQTIAFASFIVAVGLTADIDKGIVDRMRSLPIHPSAVLVGRSMSSLIHSSIGILVMSLTGLVVGWRIRGSVLDAMLAYGLLLLWGFAMIWLGILVGSAMRSVEAVNGVMFTTIFPITFLSNAFAPTEAMTPVLRTIAEWNPISALVQAVRELWGNTGPAPADAALPLQHPEIATVLWTLAITAVVAPLALRAFRARTQQ